MIRSEKYINQHKEDTPMTQAQATTIREMAMAEKSNAEIIEATGLPAAEVYAFRSKHGITRDKVKAILAEQAKPEPILVEQTTSVTDAVRVKILLLKREKMS